MMVLLFTLATWLIVFDGWKSKWLLDLLDQYLNENISFVERGTIWKNAVQNIVVAPIFGYGTGAVQISQDMEGISRSAHNNYLQLTIFGGVPALILYFILIFNSLKIRVDKHKQKYFYDAMVVIAFFLLAYMFEQNPFYVGFYVMLMISWKFQSIKLSTGKTEIKYVTG
jgi:O-antigen ligase